ALESGYMALGKLGEGCSWLDPECAGHDRAVEYIEARIAEPLAAVIDHAGVATLAHAAAAERMRRDHVAEQAPQQRRDRDAAGRAHVLPLAASDRLDDGRRPRAAPGKLEIPAPAPAPPH